MAEWFGASWAEIGGVAASTLALYATAVLALRVAGRRTVSQMSAFDFVVTIAIGSLVASTVLNPNPSYSHAVAGLGTLLGAQQLTALIRQRIPATRRFLDFQPEVVYEDGGIRLRRSSLTAQITEDELRSKLRQAGVDSVEDVR